MTIQSIVENELVQDSSSVWRLKDHGEFGYSDGAQSERYLAEVFQKATDLSSRSDELTRYIKDWPSEYHLTRKRAQLLAGFDFDRSLRVLEVGCGCGAITRHLGESFDEVVSVEGSLNRARLARLRTRDLTSVSIVCAPFQDIKFTQKFDLIVCIGVYEYSASFVDGDDPYDAALRYFADMLTPNGMVVIAIENQFGLKYFSSATEDHLGVMFEGLEGYHRRARKVRTFGKTELETNLKKYFQTVHFYYPYPDYKLPDCVISQEFLSSGRAGELVSQMKSRDYSSDSRPLWDEALTSLELSRNKMLDFFANSFLVLASRGEIRGAAFDQQAVMFSSSRDLRFATRTRIVQRTDGQLVVTKQPLKGMNTVDGGSVKLVATESPWIDALSLQSLVYLRSSSRDRTLADIFEPCKKWVDLLESVSIARQGVKYLAGEHVDSIWANVYPAADGCRTVDREWVWNGEVQMNAVVIRAIYDFLSKIENTPSVARALHAKSGRVLISDIAAAIGIPLTEDDFAAFIKLETELQFVVFGVSKKRQFSYLRWFLLHRPSLNYFRKSKRRAFSILSSARSRILHLA